MIDYSKLFSDEFPKEFYDFIYGSVHHHDYAEYRSTELINRFGKVKFLDIGCSCGILVKKLIEKGAEAYGIEVSDYALSQSCAPEWVQKGDIRNIPFPDDYFDVVHSCSVFGYTPEKDVYQSISECLRVGKIQSHAIDYETSPPSYGYKFMKPREWWYERLNIVWP